MVKIDELLDKHEVISCILPHYEKNLGNTTKVILENSMEITYPQSPNSILRSIASYYGLHLRLVRKKQAQLLNSKYYLPLPINDQLLLYPVKIRIPRIKNDSSLAYINYYSVDKINYKEACIYLKNGKIIKSLNSSATLEKRYHQARISRKFYVNTMASNNYVKDENLNYLYPATKGDLEEIKRELASIKGTLAGILSTKYKDQ
ncbi:MAG: hypothetical protein GX214_04490 [Clostridiales bacterium]|nr:hypothetical protein [Clostridiales bacterium]